MRFWCINLTEETKREYYTIHIPRNLIDNVKHLFSDYGIRNPSEYVIGAVRSMNRELIDTEYKRQQILTNRSETNENINTIKSIVNEESKE